MTAMLFVSCGAMEPVPTSTETPLADPLAAPALLPEPAAPLPVSDPQAARVAAKARAVSVGTRRRVTADFILTPLWVDQPRGRRATNRTTGWLVAEVRPILPTNRSFYKTAREL